jgi:threonine-phosphate decarboxylase
MALNASAPHGGNVHAAARELKRPIGSLLDFSASINPLGPSPQAVRAYKQSLGLIGHYPDPDCTALKTALASRLAMPTASITIGNGSSELIHALPRALNTRHALIVGPTFSSYASAVELAGGGCSFLFARRTECYRPPLEGVLRSIREDRKKRRPIDTVFLCNPNSPTGRLCDARLLSEVIHAARRAGVWLVLDETFIEYCPEQSMLKHLPACSRLILLRSFTKFYALPGIRVGYAIASRQVITDLQRHLPAWSVNSAAQLAAVAALHDHRHAARSLKYMDRARTRLLNQLSTVAGVTVIPTCCNFLLLELSTAESRIAVVGLLRRKGILVRDCSNVPGLTPRSIRVAIRSRADNDRFVSAIKRVAS